MIEGVFFDFDGTLVDSEPLWKQAKLEIFDKEGIPISEEDCDKTRGLPSYETVSNHVAKVGKATRSIAEITADLNQRVLVLLKEVHLKPGVIGILEFFREKNIPMAVCSSSQFRMIQTALVGIGIEKYFKFLYSGDFEQFGKPHPAVYISAATKLSVNILRCIAFEDSMNVLLAAKSARLKAVAVLDEGQINDTRYDFADMKIESFHNFGQAEYDFIQSLI